MLTWWLQVDVHINEDDYFQQNLQLTLQAMAMDVQEDKIKLNKHEEISLDLNVILFGQLGTWLSCGMKKLGVFTTGKGDIFFRMICSTAAHTFLLAEEQGKTLKLRLEYALNMQFGVCLSAGLVKVTLVAVQGVEMPTIKPVVDKELVLLVTTEETSIEEDINGAFQKDYYDFENYNTDEVEDMMVNFYGEETILTPPPSANSSFSDEFMFE